MDFDIFLNYVCVYFINIPHRKTEALTITVHISGLAKEARELKKLIESHFKLLYSSFTLKPFLDYTVSNGYSNKIDNNPNIFLGIQFLALHIFIN